MSGRGEINPYVDEKFIIPDFLLFLANSLHTENRVVTLVFKYSSNVSNGKLKRLFFRLFFDT